MKNTLFQSISHENISILHDQGRLVFCVADLSEAGAIHSSDADVDDPFGSQKDSTKERLYNNIINVIL